MRGGGGPPNVTKTPPNGQQGQGSRGQEALVGRSAWTGHPDCGHHAPLVVRSTHRSQARERPHLCATGAFTSVLLGGVVAAKEAFPCQ